MKESEPKELVLRTSRIYFLGNYFLAALVIVFIVLLWTNFDLKFTLLPSTGKEFRDTLLLLGLFALASVFVEQPEWERFRTKFFVTMNEVIKQQGILTKERVILPYATVADIRIEKSIIGRLLNYGTLSVSSFKTGSDMVMKGIRNPEKIHVMIQNRVNLIREGQMEFFKKEEKPEEVVRKEVKLKDTKEDLENKKKEN